MKRNQLPGLQGVTPSPFNLPVGGWYLAADEITLILWWLGDFPELLNWKRQKPSAGKFRHFDEFAGGMIHADWKTNK